VLVDAQAQMWPADTQNHSEKASSLSHDVPMRR
jgi:hypothetical protein